MNASSLLNRIDNKFDSLVNKIGNKPWLFLILIIIINVFLKAYNLHGASLWFDEVSQINMSLSSFKDIISNSFDTPNGLLYTVILSFWMKLFGIGEVATRSLSVIFSVVTVPFIFFFARKHFNAFTAIFASLMFTVSHLHLYYSHEVRSYTLVSLLVVISFYVFLDIIHEPKRHKTIILVIINTLLLYTHLTSILIFAAQGLYIIIYPKHPKKIWPIGLSFIIPVLFLSVWFFNNTWFGGDETTWGSVPSIRNFFNMFISFANKGNSIILGVLLVLYFWYLRKNREIPVKVENFQKKTLFLLFWAVVPVIIMYLASICYNPRFTARYMLYASIGLYLLLPFIASDNRFPNKIKVFVLGVFVIISGLTLNLNPDKNEDWKGAINYYQDIKTPNSATIVSAWYQWVTFSYYNNPGYFKEYDDPPALMETLSTENIYFTNGTGILKQISLDDKEKIILILSHYKVVDPDQKLLNHFKENYIETGESENFPDIRIRVFTNPPNE